MNISKRIVIKLKMRQKLTTKALKMILGHNQPKNKSKQLKRPNRKNEKEKRKKKKNRKNSKMI